MRPGITVAVIASLLLVGGASWSRLEGREEATLIVERMPDEYYEDIVAGLTEEVAIVDIEPSRHEPLTNTDLIGRDLLLEYVDLASGGGASEATIAALAEQYAASIPALTGERVSLLNIRTVTNTQANFENYAQALANIYTAHSNRISQAYAGASNGVLDQTYYAATRKAANTYEETATALKALAVPTALVTPHLELVNKHFSSAAAQEALAETEKDPITGMAGLITLNQNLEREAVLMQEVERILNTHDIY